MKGDKSTPLTPEKSLGKTPYSIKEISKTGLIEPDYDKLIENKLATNLFLS